MNPPRLIACYFEVDGSAGQWGRMARVLERTAATHCPGWHVQIDRLSVRRDPRWPAAPASHGRNTQKLGHWIARALAAADGDRVALMDADAVILRPLDPVWELEFDLAYTVKDREFPFNAGVLFFRMSDRIRAFLLAWLHANATLMMESGPRPWMLEYGGVNQASLGPLVGHPPVALAIEPLPCREWNCENTTWRHFDPAVTRVLHLKSGLRRACFSRIYETPETSVLARLWQSIEAQETRVSA